MFMKKVYLCIDLKTFYASVECAERNLNPFKTNLVSPGDSMTYTITVANEGDLDAILDSIETTDTNNPAILFSVNGINQNDVLLDGENVTFTVTVTYNPDTESQPTNLVSSLTVKLNYVQNK